MKIHSVYFDGGPDDFSRLRKVFERSFASAMPDVETILTTIPAVHNLNGKTYGIASNTHKLAEWAKIVQNATEDIILCDCDLMAVDRIDDAWKHPFDIGYTVRRGPFPFNGGVLYVRNTPEAKAIVAEWLRINNEMFANASAHTPWQAKYGGINQAAFGMILEKKHMPGRIAALPSIYNACDYEWATLRNPRVYHVKSRLRRICLNSQDDPRLRHIAAKFREFEND